MHLQSSLQRPLRYVCITVSVDLLAYTYALVEIYDVYKPEPWYKLCGGCILVQITPLQDFGAEMGGGGGGWRLLRGGLILRILRY